MEIRDNEKLCIIAPLCEKINEYEGSRIIKQILSDNRSVALDLNYVHDCTIDFIEKLKNICSEKKIGIFNISSDMFALFNFMEMDKAANIFVSEIDFEENTRQIVNRRFKIV